MPLYFFSFLTIFFLKFTIFSQTIEVTGVVMNDKKQPLSDVSIIIPDLNIGTYTNTKGLFFLKTPSKNHTIRVNALGFKEKEIKLDTLKGDTNIHIILEEDLLGLDEVIVTAKKKFSKEGTSSYKIESQAIKQIQAFNLGDVLSLLPGNKITPPDLTNSQTANIRSAIASEVNSFGTSIIVDGVAQSNDANLQAKNASISTSSGDNSTVGSGFDLRNVSLANIASIEVISGVPSPKYGNLSTGGIIVKSKVGASPWIANANVSSTNYQASITKGVKLSKLGTLNTDVSYSYASGAPTQRKVYYQNLNAGLRWKLPVFKSLDWNHFTSFRVRYSDDGTRHEPDEFYEVGRDVKSTAYQVAFSGDFKNKILGRVSYNFNGSLTNQYSFFDTYDTNGPYPIVEALESGTNFTTFTPTLYTIIKEIEGRPINFNTSLEASQHLNSNNFDFTFETGLQYTFDHNTGSGSATAGNVSIPGDIIGSRSTSFEDVRPSKNFSAYHQTRILHTGEETKSRLNLGVRYDYMIERFNLFSPRLSASTKYSDFNFRAAWGLSYKAPAIIQLYPGKTYIDYTNLSYYAENPEERLAIVTTYVQQPNNENLKPNYTDLREVGFDYNTSFLNLQFTYFKKKLRRGIQQTEELLILPRQEYEVVATPENEAPIVEAIPGDITTISRTINVLKNNYFVDTDGLEIIIDPPKIRATNTKFNFKYSYLQSFLTDTGYDIKASSFVVGANETRYGVYENSHTKSIRSFGTLTLIQHIPALRFVLTLSAEFNFKEYSTSVGASLYPFAYYDSEGNFIEIPEENRENTEFDDLKKEDFIFTPSTDIPFFTNFNLQIRKETKKGHSFSFFANNAPWYNPEYEQNGNRQQLNDQLSVGFNLSLLIK